MKKPAREKNDPTKQGYIGDIVRASTNTVLDLKKKIPVVQVDFGQIKKWWQVHQHKFFIILSFLIGGIILSSFSTGHASVAKFYPASCLGDWEKVEHATGEPTLPAESSLDQFSLENSARMPASVSTIYCGGFTGSIPENSTPTSYKLTLSWAVDDGSIKHQTTQPFETTSADGTVTIPETVQEQVTEEQKIDQPEPIKEQSADEGVTSWMRVLDIFAPKQVLAQESTQETPVEPTAEVPSDTLDQVVDETINNTADASVETQVPQTIEVSAEEATIDTSTAEDTTVAQDTIDATPADAFMEVEYTTDGSTWHSLGTISRSAWQRASFEIPLSGWENTNNLQVALKALPSFDAMPVVYLDAMELSVEYTDMEDLVAPPTVLLNDSSEVISGKNDFDSVESAGFDLTVPNYDVDTIKTLVEESKATVIKDTNGVLGERVADPKIKEETDEVIDTIKDTVDTTKKKIESIPINPAPVDIQAETVSFIQRLLRPSIAYADEQSIDVQVLDRNGQEAPMAATVVANPQTSGPQTYHVDIKQTQRQFTPGKYTLVVTFKTPQAIVVSRQDFTWGVLVINTSQSVYAPGDTAYFQMGVLNDTGHTICNAQLDLDVTSPHGVVTTLSTRDGSLVREPECGPDNVISVPDYYARMPLGDDIGTYTMKLRAQTDNGPKTIESTFEVEAAPLFEVVRIAPTRIYPQAMYPSTLKVTSPVDWEGTVSERVPASFEISQPEQSLAYDSIDEQGDTKIISWNVSLRAGEPAMLGFYFDAPDISPELFILGKATFTTTDGAEVFEEARQWQIASDAACNATGSGDWSTTANFTNCTGAPSGGSGTGNRPGVNDVLTINSGVSLTADTNATITGLTFAASTVAANFIVNDGVSFVVTGTTSIPAPGGAVANTLTVGQGVSGSFSTAGITITGSATSGRTSVLALSAGSTFTSTAGITFAGTAARAQLSNTTASTINLTGTMSSGGTVSIYAATVLNTSGTVAINGAYTFGVLNVNSGTTTMGGVAITYAGLVTIANGATLTASSGSGLKNFIGGMTVNSGGTFDLKTGSNFATASAWGSDITMNGTLFNSGTGNVAISGTGSLYLLGSSPMSLGGTLTIPANKIIVNSNTSTVTLGAVTVGNAGAGTNGMDLSTGSTTSVTGALAYANAVSGQTQSVTLNGTAALSAGSVSVLGTSSLGSATIACASGATGSLTVAGLVSVTGSSSVGGGSSSINFGSTACSLTAGALTSAGGSVGTGSVIMGTGALTVNGQLSFGSAANVTRSLLTTGANTIYLNNGTLAASGTLSIGSAALVTSGTTSIAGAYTLPNLTVASGTTTISAATTFSGAVSIASGGELRLGSVAVTFSGSTTVNGTLQCIPSATCVGLKTFTGALTVNSGGVLDFTAGAPTVAPSLRFDSNVTANGTTFNTNTGALTIGTSLSLLGSSGMTLGAVTINSAVTLTNGNTGTVAPLSIVIASPSSGSNGLSLSTGSTTTVTNAITYTANATANSQTITMNGTANISSDSLTINRPTTTGGQSNITCASGGSGTFSTTNAALINGASTAAATVNVLMNSCNFSSGGLLTLGGGTTGGNITFTTTSGTLSALGGITFAGTAARDVFTVGSGNFNLSGTMVGAGTITIDPSNTLVTSGTTTISGGYTFGNLHVASGTTTLGAAIITFGGTTNIDGSLISGTGGGLKTFSGLVTVNSGGVFDMTGFNPPLSFGGGIAMNGTTFTTGTSTVAMTASQSLTGSSNITIGGSVTVGAGQTLTNASGAVVQFAGPITGGDSLAVFTTSGGSVTKFADSVMATGLLVPSTSAHSIEYNGDAQSVKTTTTNPYYNLTIGGTGTKSMTGATNISGTLLVSTSTLDTMAASLYDLNAKDITIDTTGTLLGKTSTITVTGNWTNLGVFTADTSTVVLSGGATALVSGDTVFNNLTIAHTGQKEVQFQTAGSPVFEVTGLFNATGTSGNVLKLYSDTPGTQWHFKPSGSASVAYVEARDSACESGSIPLSPSNFTNGGNNGTCWITASLTFSISDASLGFGTLSASSTRYATGDGLGSGSDAPAHTISISSTAPSGYTLSVLGDPLSIQSHTLSAIGPTPASPATGVEQFGLRMTASGGIGAVSSPYDGSDFAYDASSIVSSEVASAPTGDGVVTTYSANYMCNISQITPPGSYSTGLTYVVTGNF